MTKKILIGYIVFIFILQAISAFLPPKAAAIYLSFSIFVMGIAAIIVQKKLHHQKFLDLGFRLNRNALIGLGIGLVYTIIIFGIHYLAPLKLGFVYFSLNPELAGITAGQFISILLMTIFLGGIPLFIASLFGEELAFRGYILPKFNELYGSRKAILFSVVIFSLWHLPTYFSLYSGGVLEEGGFAVILMLIVHALTAIPLCILYLTTRELYGVSLIHALVDVLQYAIIGNPYMGEASRGAIYQMDIINPAGLEVNGWVMYLFSIFIMLGLCSLVKKTIIRNKA